MIQAARGWCTGMTQRDVMGREVGGDFRIGNTCTLMADSSQCMAKPVQYYKITKLIFKKKEDLGDYLEDPEKHIRAFKGITLLYDLS